MDTMEMITKALDAVVEQKVAEQVAEKASTADLDSVLKFVEANDIEKLNTVLKAIFKKCPTVVEDFVRDEGWLTKDDLDDSDIKELAEDRGLYSDIAEEYLDNMYSSDLREKIKDMIDKL